MRRQSATLESLRRSSLISLSGLDGTGFMDSDLTGFPTLAHHSIKPDGHESHMLELVLEDPSDPSHAMAMHHYQQQQQHHYQQHAQQQHVAAAAAAMHNSTMPWMHQTMDHSRPLYLNGMMNSMGGMSGSMLNMPFVNNGYDDMSHFTSGAFASLDDGPHHSMMNMRSMKVEQSVPIKKRKAPQADKPKKQKISEKAQALCVTPSSGAQRALAPQMDPKAAKAKPGAAKPGTPAKKPAKRSREASSKYRGVSRCSKDGRFQARIRVGAQVKYLGRFKSEADAARCYDQAAASLHGKRAQFNFPESVGQLPK